MIVVGITGKRRAGKDTFAGVLVREFGFKRYAFADALKRDVADFLLMRVEELEARKEDFRAALQEYGTRWRQRNPEVWVNRLEDDIQLHEPARVVIPDVRFMNEADFIRQQGGIMVRVRRRVPVQQGALDAHASETEMDGIEADLDEFHGSVEELEAHAWDFTRGKGW